MTTSEISIHQVTSITISDRKLLGADSTNPFWSREILITNERGEQVCIALFSNSEDEDTALKVQS